METIDTNTDTTNIVKLGGAVLWLLYICILVISKKRSVKNKNNDIDIDIENNENNENENSEFDDEEQNIRKSSFRYILSVCRRRLLGIGGMKPKSGSESCNNVTVVDL